MIGLILFQCFAFIAKTCKLTLLMPHSGHPQSVQLVFDLPNTENVATENKENIYDENCLFYETNIKICDYLSCTSELLPGFALSSFWQRRFPVSSSKSFDSLLMFPPEPLLL